MSDFDLPGFNSAALTPLLDEFAPTGRSALLPALHAVQSAYGYLPEPVAAEVGRRLGVPLADVHGVIDFYSMFYRQPTGQSVIHVCCDPACALSGSDEVLRAISQYLGVAPGDVTADGRFTVLRAPCLGLCDHAPGVLAGETAFGHVDA